MGLSCPLYDLVCCCLSSHGAWTLEGASGVVRRTFLSLCIYSLSLCRQSFHSHPLAIQYNKPNLSRRTTSRSLIAVHERLILTASSHAVKLLWCILTGLGRCGSPRGQAVFESFHRALRQGGERHDTETSG